MIVNLNFVHKSTLARPSNHITGIDVTDNTKNYFWLQGCIHSKSSKWCDANLCYSSNITNVLFFPWLGPKGLSPCVPGTLFVVARRSRGVDQSIQRTHGFGSRGAYVRIFPDSLVDFRDASRMRRPASITLSRRAGRRVLSARLGQAQSVAAANQGMDSGMRRLRQAVLGDPGTSMHLAIAADHVAFWAGLERPIPHRHCAPVLEELDAALRSNRWFDRGKIGGSRGGAIRRRPGDRAPGGGRSHHGNRSPARQVDDLAGPGRASPCSASAQPMLP